RRGDLPRSGQLARRLQRLSRVRPSGFDLPPLGSTHADLDVGRRLALVARQDRGDLPGRTRHGGGVPGCFQDRTRRLLLGFTVVLDTQVVHDEVHLGAGTADLAQADPIVAATTRVELIAVPGGLGLLRDGCRAAVYGC